MAGDEQDSSEYLLHEAVFKGDLKRLSKLLRSHDVSEKDHHGKI